MKRKVVQIDEAKCNGCGACASACHEGAIGMVDGKARLLRDDFCDGMGDCLPACLAGAISFVEREAAPYDEKAVQFARKASSASAPAVAARSASELAQWPCQIRLVPANAPFFRGADLLIAADCTAYAYADFHRDFMRGRTTVVGCPKLDPVDYSEKLADVFGMNDVRSVTLVRMEVPCCGGLEAAARRAIQASGKPIPLRVVTISRDGRVLPPTGLA